MQLIEQSYINILTNYTCNTYSYDSEEFNCRYLRHKTVHDYFTQVIPLRVFLESNKNSLQQVKYLTGFVATHGPRLHLSQGPSGFIPSRRMDSRYSAYPASTLKTGAIIVHPYTVESRFGSQERVILRRRWVSSNVTLMS